MENKPKEQIAISLFTGAIISLFLIIEGLIENFLDKILVLSILIIIIFISLKLILDSSADLHIFGDMIRKFLRIRNQN